MTLAGGRLIGINANLDEADWLRVAYHELGHHFFHTPLPPLNLRHLFDPQKEREADAFAMGALIVLLHLAHAKGGGR